MALLKMNFLSQALRLQTNITVILPTMSFADMMDKKVDDYYNPANKFQTLWLLHGGSGDDADWVNFTSVLRYAEANKLAVVMAPAFNSCYVDMAHGGNYYTFFTEELPKMCRAFFPLSGKREDNIIAGLSMGGMGTMLLALKRPDLYGQALCLSGAAQSYEEMVKRAASGDNMIRTDDIYGPLDSFKDGSWDAYAIAKTNISENKPLPKFYFACGDKDFALPGLRGAYEHLTALGYDTQKEEITGYGHEWDFWDLYIRKAIYELLDLKRTPVRG